MCADCVSVEAALGLVEAIPDEYVDRVRGPRDDALRVVLGVERRQHIVRDASAIAAARTSDTDPHPEKLLRPQPLRDRPEAVVPGEAAARASLQPTGLEVD